MKLKPIKTEKDYNLALSQVDKLWGAKKNTDKGDAFEILITLIEAYEEKHYPIKASNPIEAIEYVMEEKNLKRSDLTKIFGSKSLVSDVLNKKRALTIKMIKGLHEILGIPYELLIV